MPRTKLSLKLSAGFAASLSVTDFKILAEI